MTYAFYTFFRSLDSTCNRAHVANTSINEVPTVEKSLKFGAAVVEICWWTDRQTHTRRRSSQYSSGTRYTRRTLHIFKQLISVANS